MTGERIVMPRKLAATAAVLALAGALAAGCSKKLTTDPSITVPEGTPSSQLELVTFTDQSANKIRLTDRPSIAKVNFAPDSSADSIQTDASGHPLITSYRQFAPGTVRGLVFDRTAAEGMEIWRTDPNGGVRRLFDFALQPTQRILSTATNLYEFYDSDPNRSPNATYYARGLIGGVGSASSPVSNGSRPSTATLVPISYQAQRFGTPLNITDPSQADSNIFMKWTPVPGAARYLIQIFTYKSRVLTLGQRILTGAPAPILTDAHDVFLASVPGTISQFHLGVDPGATVYVPGTLRMNQEYYIRISALDANGALIGATMGETIQQSSDLKRILLWQNEVAQDYFVDFSSPEVANATPPAYLLYSRGAIWVSPGADPVRHEGGGGGGP
jgi:hypothetical protein